MKLVICDDVREDAEKTIRIINDYFENMNDESDIIYFSPDELSCEIEKGEFEFDIAILDIDYKNDNYNGIDLARKINELSPLCNIIYLTAILDFASDVYETEHCYFVMKKNQQKTLKRALDKAVRIVNENNENKYIKLTSSGKEILILTNEIRYLTRENRKVQIIGDNTFESYISLGDCIEMLPKKFVRCHTGYIVNLDYIKVVEGNKIMLSDDTFIPIGRVYKDSFMYSYLEYLERRV
ncbi:MAG: response regulator transcription factor [Lachnospiraceae bacterium]|nr:response regulator transcription factor [Lachnospiraceae bacterium]